MFSFKVQCSNQELVLQTPGYSHAGVLRARPLHMGYYDPHLNYVHGTFYVRDCQGRRILLNMHQAIMYLFWHNLIVIEYIRSSGRCGKFQYAKPNDCVRFGVWYIASNLIAYGSGRVAPLDNFTLHKSLSIVCTAHTKWHLLTFVALSMAINGAHLEY